MDTSQCSIMVIKELNRGLAVGTKTKILIGFGLIAGITASTQAATMSTTYRFTASDFKPIVNPASVSVYATVRGSFTLTYDRLVSKPEGPTGIVLHHLDTPLGSPVEFEYDFVSVANDGVVEIGGSQNGAALGGTTNDFYLSFQRIGSGPLIDGNFLYSNGSVLPNETFQAGTVSVSEVAAVPESAAWELAIAGFGIVGAVARGRRLRSTLADEQSAAI